MRNETEIWGVKAPQTRKESVMSILSTIGRLAAEYSEARARYLTERSIQFPADRAAEGHRLAGRLRDPQQPPFLWTATERSEAA